MMPWDDIQTFMGSMAQDKSATAMTFLKMMYNAGYKIVLLEFGRQVTEDEAIIDLENARRAYQVGPDVMTPKQVDLIDGTSETPLVEVSSDRLWTTMKSQSPIGTPTHYHYKPRFGVGGGVLEILPAPAGDALDMRLTYEVRDKDLSQDAVTIASGGVVTGDATVTGSGFSPAMIGRYFQTTKAGSDKLPYKIVGINSASSLELEQNYFGLTDNAISYRIVEIPNLPDDLMLVPAYFALEQWWSSKSNAKKQQEFQIKWSVAMTRAKKTHANTTRDALIAPTDNALNLPGLPSYFPTTIS